MKGRVLVTGAAGFIGSHTCERFLREGWEVVGCDENFPGKGNLDGILSAERFEPVCSDICDTGDIVNLFNSFGPFSVIVHLAASAGVNQSIDLPYRYYGTNVTGTLNLLEFLQIEEQQPRFIFASSSSVYGSWSNLPLCEDESSLRPMNPYAATKVAGEAMCHAWHHLYKIPMVCLRFFTVFGPRQRPDLSISRFIEALSKGEPITVYGDGMHERDFTYVDDTVDAIYKAATVTTATVLTGNPKGKMDRKEIPFPRFEIINVGCGRTKSINEVIEEVGNAMDVKNFEVIHQPARDYDMRYTEADTTRAKKLLGWKPTVGLSEGIERQVEWYKEQKQ